jgi:hypothetical protein
MFFINNFLILTFILYSLSQFHLHSSMISILIDNLFFILFFQKAPLLFECFEEIFTFLSNENLQKVEIARLFRLFCKFILFLFDTFY